MKKIIMIFALTIFSSPAFSWVESTNVTIDEMIIWDGGDTGNVHFKLSNGEWCYVAGTQKNMYSLILALYASGRKAHVHCYDAADQNGGGSVAAAHRLHRIIAIKN